MQTRTWWLIGAFLAAILLAIVATTPPRPEASSADPASISTQRAFAHVERIAREPHVTGSAANGEIREYLIAELAGMGLAVRTVDGTLGDAGQQKLDYWRGTEAATPTTFTNVIGVLPGRDPALPAIALMAHYDSVWGSPGAADDAAGVASILETVRAMVARGQARRDVVVLLTDAEELGLEGARAFFADDPLADRVGAIVNLEARGGGGIASMFQTSPNNAAAARFYARAVAQPATSSLSAYIYSVLPNDTDLTPALDRGGYTAYNIAFIGRSGLYHSPLATPANLDRGALHHMLGQTHALATALADAEALPVADSDAVFFDVFGLFVVTYAPWLGWLMLVASVGGLAYAFVRHDEAKGNFLGGIARMGGFLLVSGLLLYGLNWLSGAGVGAGYYDRLAAIPKLTVMAGLALASVTAVIWGGRALPAAVRIGAASLLLVLALAAQALAPTAAYFLVIPVLLAGVVEALRTWLGENIATIAAAIVAAIVTGYMLYLGFFMMQGVGPSMPYVAAIPATLGVLSWLPLWPGLPRHRAIAAILLVVAIGVALWIRFDPVAETVAAYSPLKPG